MIRIKSYLNFIIKNFLIFLFCITWANFYIKDFKLSLIVSLFFTVIISTLLSKIFLSKSERKTFEKENQLKVNSFYNYLLFAKDEDINNLVINIVQKKHNVTKSKNLLFVNDIPVFNLVTKQKVKVEDILKVIKGLSVLNKNKALILCLEIDNEAQNFINKIENFQIEVYDYLYMYNNINTENLAPAVTFKKGLKINLKQFLLILFNKKNAKSFFMLGIIMFISSFFTFYSFYYSLYASIMFAFAVICLFLKPQKTRKTFL